MTNKDSDAVSNSKAYLRGTAFPQTVLDQLWPQLKKELEFGYARQVLENYYNAKLILGQVTLGQKKLDKLCQQWALCMSKDPDVSAAVRHDRALAILSKRFTLQGYMEDGEKVEVTKDQESLGIAGGILKRKWSAFGQIDDLKRSLELYNRGYVQGIASDFGYTAINTAYVQDLLASMGDESTKRSEKAEDIRREVVDKVTPLSKEENNKWLNNAWWYRTTLAEAHFGLDQFDAAKRFLEDAVELKNVDYWEFETTANQLVQLAWSRHGDDAVENPEILGVLQVLVGQDGSATTTMVGKVGLALSGGGFRASFYHLGVLARLAELDVLRHVDLLSCVSGGSVVGAAYYLKLRSLIEQSPSSPIEQPDYIDLVKTLIKHFEECVSTNVRAHVQEGWLGLLRNLWTDQGGLQSEDISKVFDDVFYAPLMGMESGRPMMHELTVQPADHNPSWRNQGAFNPKLHNWRRKHKVPGLILNATTVNTGHAWQFTTTWMGESPYSIHEEVDAVPRLRRAWYNPGAREVSVGTAVAASTAVPGVFAPVQLEKAYELNKSLKIDVFLSDGGVYDNQGTVSLIAQDCNIILVSDACGQLKAAHASPSGPRGLLNLANRSQNILMERIRMANYGDLKTRLRSGQLRGLMFLNMKDGLETDPIEWTGSQEKYAPTQRTVLSRTGVRRDFQQRVSEIRTDLNDFEADEARYIMACGYQMASSVFQDSLASIPGLSIEPTPQHWTFNVELDELTDTSEKNRSQTLDMLDAGSKVPLNPD